MAKNTFLKHFRRRANRMLVLSASVSVMLFLHSCKDEEGLQQPVIETIEHQSIVADTPQTFTSLSTYVFDGDYPASANVLLRRISNKAATFDDAVTTAVFTDEQARLLDDTSVEKLIALYLRGGNIVYVEPTTQGITEWMAHVKRVYQDMAAKGSLPADYSQLATAFYSRFMSTRDDANGNPLPPYIDNADTDGVICDMIALRGTDIHVVSDLDDGEVGKVLVEEVDEETGEKLSAETESQAGQDEVTEYMYGQHAELMVVWLNRQPDYMTDKEKLVMRGRQMLAQAGDIEKSKLDEIIDAQKVSRTFNIASKGHSEPVTVQYEIWSASDKDLTDYYLINETVTLENSKLGCGPESSKKWYKDDNGKNTYGPYLYKFATQHTFSDNRVAIEQVAPTNSTSGTTTCTHGFDWSLNAALTFAKDPSLGIGGGVSFSKSWSYDIPDLELTHSKNSNAPKWEYIAGTRPTSHWGSPVTHTAAKPILRTDCSVSHSWIWKIANASDTYSFTTNTDVSIQFLHYDNGFFKTNPKYFTHTRHTSATFQLAPPPRYLQEWLMSYTPYSNETQTMLEKQFPKYWKLAFDLPVVQENDRTMIDSRINTIIEMLKNNRSTLHDKGIDQLKISWKLLSSPNVYRTYEYKY